MITSKDPTRIFIPNKKIQFIILGTMCAINAREVGGKKPSAPYFYYNNSRNHFWRVLQHLLSPEQTVKTLTIKEKKNFLNDNGIAICNLVSEIQVPKKDQFDPSDTILFEAYKKDRIKFKKVTKSLKLLLKTKPIFFTCRRKKGIENLMDGFFKTNNLEIDLDSHVWFWPTPTRCNPYDRAQIWKEEGNTFYKKFNSRKNLF